MKFSKKEKKVLSSPKALLIMILFLLGVVLLLGTRYPKIQNSKSTKIFSSPTKPISSWKTYAGSYYEIKYPGSNTEVYERPKAVSPDLTGYGTEQDVNYKLNEAEAGLRWMEIEVYSKEKFTTIDQLFSKKISLNQRIRLQETTLINNRHALRYVLGGPVNPAYYNPSISDKEGWLGVIIESKTNLFNIFTHIDYKLDSQGKIIPLHDTIERLDEVLTTFSPKD